MKITLSNSEYNFIKHNYKKYLKSIFSNDFIKEKYTCLLCAENRVKDGLWKQEEMNDRMYGLGDEQ